MEIPPSGEEQQKSPEQSALEVWHNLDIRERNPFITSPEIEEEIAFVDRGRRQLSQAIIEHRDAIVAELEERKKAGEKQAGRSFPPHYKAVTFINDYVSQNMLGWAIRKHDVKHPGKFAFWYQQYLGANFVLRYLTESVESLRGNIVSDFLENERLRRTVLSPENLEPDPEDVILAVMDARELEKLLIQDKTGFLLAERAVDDAARWAVANRYSYVTSGAEFATDIYKQVYELTNPSSHQQDVKK